MSLNIFRTYTHTLTKNIKVYNILGNVVDITPFNDELNDMLHCEIDEHLQLDEDDLLNWCGYGGDIVAVGSQLIYTQKYTTIFKSDSDYLLNMDFQNSDLTSILEDFFDECDYIAMWSYGWGGEISMKTNISNGDAKAYYTWNTYYISSDAYFINKLYYINTITKKICVIMYNNYIKKKIKKIFTKDIDVSYVISSFLTINENILNV
jgi:hypothetical protein